MDNMHHIKVFSTISLLLSLANVARLNAMLAVICERTHRVKMQNLASIMEESNYRIRRISHILNGSSRRKRKPRQFWQRPGRTSVKGKL